MGLQVEERDLQPYDAVNADEAFITSPLICIMSVTRFNGQPIGDGKPGPLTGKLTERWKEQLDFDFVAQAKGFIETQAVASGR